MDKNGVFLFREDSDASLTVERIEQTEGVPNCDHSSAVTVYNSCIYAFDQYATNLWEFANQQWKMKHFLKVTASEFGA